MRTITIIVLIFLVHCRVEGELDLSYAALRLPCANQPPVVMAGFRQDYNNQDDSDEKLTYALQEHELILYGFFVNPDDDTTCRTGGDCKFSWSFIETPVGSDLYDEDIRETNTWNEAHFTPDLPGDYELELTITDDPGECMGETLQDTDQLFIPVMRENKAPVFDLPAYPGCSDNQSCDLHVGDTIGFDANDWVEDPDALDCEANPSLYRYQWNILAEPDSPPLHIPGKLTNSSLSFYPEVKGTYVLELKLTDDAGICGAGDKEVKTEISIKVLENEN